MTVASVVAFPTQSAALTVSHHHSTEILNVTHQLRYILHASETDSGSYAVAFYGYMEYCKLNISLVPRVVVQMAYVLHIPQKETKCLENEVAVNHDNPSTKHNVQDLHEMPDGT
jgi:hypothetical protein